MLIFIGLYICIGLALGAAGLFVGHSLCRLSKYDIIGVLVASALIWPVLLVQAIWDTWQERNQLEGVDKDHDEPY